MDRRSPASLWMDAIRAIAAIAVVVSHARDLLVRDYEGQLAWSGFYLFTGLGRQAVIVFFVISGFWIGKSVLEGAGNRHFWRHYLVSRFSRLYIVLIPALLLGGLMDYMGHYLLGLPVYTMRDAHSMQDVSIETLSIQNFLGNALYLQYIFVPVFGTNGPLWSLAYEFWFYIWFPAIFLIFTRKFSVFLISLALIYYVPMLAAYFVIWLIGVSVYYLSQVMKRYVPINSYSKTTFVSLIFAICIFVSCLILSSVVGSYVAELALATSFGLLLLVLLRIDGKLWPPPQSVARFGSRSSFSVYIIHFPIVVFAAGLARADRLQIDVVSATLVVLLTVFAVASGWAFSLFTEAHTKRLKNLISSQFKSRGI